MSHDHEHSHAQSTSQARLLWVIALNVVFVAIEFYASIQANSTALKADAGHNLIDVIGLVLTIVSIRFALLPRTYTRTFGYKKATVLASVASSGLLLFAMGEILFETILKLMNGATTVVSGTAMMIVAGVGIVINGFSAWFLNTRKNDLNMRGAYLHMLTDALVSAGVVISGVAIYVMHWGWLDAVVALVILAFIGKSTWGLLVQSINLIMDGVPSHIDVKTVEAYLHTYPNVCEVHDLHIWALSTTEAALTVHLGMLGSFAHSISLSELQQELHKLFEISHFTIQLEQQGTGECLFQCVPEIIEGDHHD